MVEADVPGFVGDTSELAFEGRRIPTANRLGEEGAGFLTLMRRPQREQVLADTIAYTKERQAFGRPSKHQDTQFKLAELAVAPPAETIFVATS